MNNNRNMKGFRVQGISRVAKLLFRSNPKLIVITLICIAISAAAASMPAIFQQQIISDIEVWYETGDWASAAQVIIPKIVLLASLYVLSLITTTSWTQLMAYITHKFLHKTRCEMFSKMQYLPIRYFDTNKYGDIMSRYTNDIDAIRQLVSQALPVLFQSTILLVVVFSIMVYYSLWLTLLVVLGVFLMLLVTKNVGKGSANYFVRQQKSVGKVEGFVQEMMNGQKVIKVFNHEKDAIRDFDKVNEELYNDSFKAHAYANILGPIIQNIGNVVYVLVALVGGLLFILQVPNIGLSTLFAGQITPITIDIIIPFLGMSKQFTGNVNQLAQQFNSIAMALAGAQRVFDLIDEKPEEDDGYVTLVNANVDDEGNITESEKQTGIWAWKHPHHDGETTYTLLQGDVRMVDVDFSYVEDKQVLFNVSVYAEPGQKVAFVGATGAGKTTITNLFNRFYDIEDGKIRYDGINITKIKKADLRRSLGLVLQDTNLFTGTVMENIRYGKLEATDQECIDAAKLAGAHDFIKRLPEGYDTLLTNNGENLSQGQRQLLAISRAAVANPPVMILDEATSSIDTHTEQIVQKGMDKLMHGRTTFVIAHRLSTVRNADVIMVLDHGKIIERGNHQKLISEKGIYYQLYTGAFEME